MSGLCFRAFFLLVGAIATSADATAQITFNYDFDNGSGLTGSTANGAYYTADRRAAIIRASDYVRFQLDGRGTVNVNLGTQSLTGGGPLARGGTSFFVVDGFRTNGVTFEQATNGNSGVSNHAGIDFNSNQTSWFTGSGTSAGSGQFDMQSIALHELTHGFGFLSLIRNATGRGLGGTGDTPATSGSYTQLDGALRIGSAVNATALLTPTQGSVQFNFAGGATLADLTGNNIYFHGEFAKAANGGTPVLMAGGGDRSHSTAANAVMLPNIGDSTDRRIYTNIDLAMLIDNGWNQFVWKNATGNFADNVANTTTARWQNLDGADALSPVGTITANAVLRFGGTGGYTATNNLVLTATGDRHLLTRLILDASAGTSTIAATGSNAFRFDSTIGVAPQVRQDGAGGFNISHRLELTGRNLQLSGNGTGRVTLSGTIGQQSGQTGAIVKLGASTFALSGNNTYSGGTTVNAGTLLVNNAAGSGTGTGAVTVNSGGTLGGTGTISGATTVNAGGTLRGDSGTGTGTLNLGNTTLVGGTGSTGATLATRLTVGGGGAINANSKVALGTNFLDLVSTAGKFNILLLDDSGLGSETNYTIILATGGANGFRRNGSAWNATTNNFTASDFTVTSGSGAWGYQNLLLGVDGSNNLTLQFTPVPEPTTVFAAGAAGLAALGLLRRRLKRSTPALVA